MRVTLVVPTARVPIGGATSLYQYANGLCRRGHEVHVIHSSYVTAPGGPTLWIDQPLRSLEELTWVGFEPGVHQRVVEGVVDPSTLPDADVIYFLGDPPPRCGRPIMFLQAFGVLPPEMDDALYRVQAPKFCIARWMIDVALEMGLPEQELVYLPYGLDHDKYRVHTPLLERPRQVAMYYNDHPLKAASVGLEALGSVHEQLPDTRFLAFGNAAPLLPIPEWLEFRQDPGQDSLVRDIYNQSRVFLFPSVKEGFGFAPIEAMACGAALVTAANGGSDDYAFHGDTALVSAPWDPQAMADHVVALLTDEARCAHIARRGRQYVQRFDWDFSAALLERHLLDYLAEPGGFTRIR